MEPSGIIIPCRVTDPQSHVMLKTLPSGIELQGLYDSKSGFFGSFSAGNYVCETVINGEVKRSATYIVIEKKRKLNLSKSFFFFLNLFQPHTLELYSASVLFVTGCGPVYKSTKNTLGYLTRDCISEIFHFHFINVVRLCETRPKSQQQQDKVTPRPITST